MALQVQGQVGPQTLADGALAYLRLGRAGELVVQELSERLYEATKRGQVFHASVPAAGVAPGTALGTTAAYALHNPRSSGKDLVVVSTVLGYVSGTLGAGVLFYCVNTDPIQAAPTGGTAITPTAGRIDGPAGAGKAYYGATLPAAPSPIRAFCSLTALLASTAVQPYVVRDFPKGTIIVPPGCILSLEAVAAAGSTPLVAPGMSWIEVPV